MLREIVHSVVWAKRHYLGQLDVPEAEYLIGKLEPSDVFIDVGAHAGAWSVPVSKALSRGKVYAFEALPYYASTLSKTMMLLGRRNVHVQNYAITKETCTVPIVWKSRNGGRLAGYTHIAAGSESQGEVVDVPGRSLDSLLADVSDRISLIKCDVEGAEYGVFLGARRLLETVRPVVYTELSSSLCERYGNSPKDVFELFAMLNYRGFVFEFNEARNVHLKALRSISDYRSNDILLVPVEQVEQYVTG